MDFPSQSYEDFESDSFYQKPFDDVVSDYGEFKNMIRRITKEDVIQEYSRKYNPKPKVFENANNGEMTDLDTCVENIRKLKNFHNVYRVGSRIYFEMD